MKKLRDLTRDELERIALCAAANLWLGEEETIDLDKPTSGGDYIDQVALVLAQVGLAPDASVDGRDAREHFLTTAEATGKESPRRWAGSLFYRDDSNRLHLLGSFDVAAESQVEAERQALDELWDHRLEAASCTPHFEHSSSVAPHKARISKCTIPPTESSTMAKRNDEQVRCRLFDTAILEGAEVSRPELTDQYEVTLPDGRRLTYGRSVREGWVVNIQVQGVTVEGRSVRLVDTDVDHLAGVREFWTRLGELCFQQQQDRQRQALSRFQDLFA